MGILKEGYQVTTGKNLVEITGAGSIELANVKQPPPPQDYTGFKFSPWGDDNNYPQSIIDAIEPNGVMESALAFKRDSHIGKGLCVYIETVDAEGSTYTKKLIKDPRIETFFANSNIEQTYFGIVDDHWTHFNYFPELIMSRDGKTIAAIGRRDPVYSRWNKLLKPTDLIDTLYFSYNWKRAANDYVLIPALDYRDPLSDLIGRGNLKGKTFILPVIYNTRGRVYYNRCPWHALRLGWLSNGSQIPAAVKALLKNQMVLKFHVQINYAYFTKKWKDFDSLSETERETRVGELISNLDKFLTDTDNYGKSWIDYFETDPNDRKIMIEDVKITAIDNKLSDLKYITEFQSAANSEILFGVGVDPTILGQNSPGGSESGSGSNKREAMWVNQQLLGPHRELTMAPWWNVVKGFNKWPMEWKLGVREIDSSQTLDKNPTKTKEVM